MKKVELLIPAGDLERLKVACIYGADAIYLGYQQFGLRSNASNFTLDEIKKGVEFASGYGVKIYVTTNIYAHQENFKGFKEFVVELQEIGVVGVIISDPGYISIVKEFAPKLEIHISTQHSLTNKYAAKFWDTKDVDRIVLARELTIDEIAIISNFVNCETEVFIHGAVCSSYSGRCTLSNHLTSRDSNRGGCAQSCRWYYDIYQGTQGKLEKLKINNPKSQFTMSAKDMQTLQYLDKIIQTGTASLKVEGRMKSLHYLATVTKVYRMAIDEYYNKPDSYAVKQEWLDEIAKAETRETYIGALIGDFSEKDQIFGEQYQTKKYDYCGQVLEYCEEKKLVKVRQRNFFKIGDTVEFFGPKDNFEYHIQKIYDDEMNEIQKANQPLMIIYLKLDEKVDNTWLVRKEN